MITESEARAIAADWHSGQGSALYAFSSSGHVDSMTELELERVVAECERRVETGDMTGPDFGDPVELLEDARAALEFVRANTPAGRAYALGVEAAEAAASWTVDGNSDPAVIARLLELMDAGDPAVDDYLPARPDLSGEWADAPTPMSLYEEVTGRSHAEAEAEAGLGYETLVGEEMDELADAWEQGVSDTFEQACEAELRRHVA